jgi:hypothetical protein
LGAQGGEAVENAEKNPQPKQKGRSPAGSEHRWSPAIRNMKWKGLLMTVSGVYSNDSRENPEKN